ncbi:Ig-like domain-containing protein [Methanobrevibacter sp.]|uniref:Ig-like domain-containing protein n=1 Tax=Methanobrevibacter sp. TaxID=66852 RepID=UPI003890BFA7
MDNNKIIMVALILVILALLAGIFTVMPHTDKQTTNLTFESEQELDEGGSIQVKLTDANGTALVNQTVNITVTDENQTNDYHSVVTNEEGIGTLNLDKSAGVFNVTISYGGNDNYKNCSATQKIVIKEKVIEAEPISKSNYDPGAFYSAQAERVIYTGEVLDTPGGPHRHLGNNKWEPV